MTPNASFLIAFHSSDLFCHILWKSVARHRRNNRPHFLIKGVSFYSPDTSFPFFCFAPPMPEWWAQSVRSHESSVPWTRPGNGRGVTSARERVRAVRPGPPTCLGARGLGAGSGRFRSGSPRLPGSERHRPRENTVQWIHRHLGSSNQSFMN